MDISEGVVVFIFESGRLFRIMDYAMKSDKLCEYMVDNFSTPLEEIEGFRKMSTNGTY